MALLELLLSQRLIGTDGSLQVDDAGGRSAEDTPAADDDTDGRPSEAVDTDGRPAKDGPAAPDDTDGRPAEDTPAAAVDTV